MSTELIDTLLRNGEPAIRWKLCKNVLDESPNSAAMKELAKEVKASIKVRQLIEGFRKHPEMELCRKWQGIHWSLMTLADLGYPSGEEEVQPYLKASLHFFTRDHFFKEYEALEKSDVYKPKNKGRGIAVIQGRHRVCASYQGNALINILTLGNPDLDPSPLVDRLLHWQWPDGGWNCDSNPSASKSTFIHTLPTMKALKIFGERYSYQPAIEAAARAKEVFLKRKFFKRQSDDKVIREEFAKLHYPLYWHYDILGALKIFAQIGETSDPRCHEALDLLESKRLPHGGWPAEKKYYKVSEEVSLGHDFVNWGPSGKSRMNPWVTVDALHVLKAFGRLKL